MEYGGFWRRLGAFFIDQIILALVITIPPWIAMTPSMGSQAMTLALPVMLMYNVFLVTLYGATPGMWLCKLKLYMQDGSAITSRAAWLRYCLVIGLHLLANLPKLWNFSLSLLPASLRHAMPFFASPWSWEEWLVSLAFVWLLSEPFIVLLNKQRRALQDYMAGTIVIKLPPKRLQQTSPIQPLSESKQASMLTGFNHLTLSVRDLDRSLAFYRGILALRLHARWDRGAYLSAGDLWLCLTLDDQADTASDARHTYTHYAFSIASTDFASFAARLRDTGVREWQQNRSAGDSLYFLDPDGYQLEAHVGSLATRLAACRAKPYASMVFFDE